MEEYEKVKKAFDNYYNNYKNLSKDIDRKYTHSLTVTKLMEELAKRLGLSKEDIILAKEIGLLHDIGRFEQLKETGSFKDSEFDHADYAVNYLFKEKHIREFIDSDKNDEVIAKAILYHNKIEVPNNLSEKEKMFANMIRDMDKTDIFYQIAMNYNPSFTDEVSKEVLDEFNKGKIISKKLLKTSSDRVVCKLAFVYDYNYDESLDILVETDNFGLFLSTVEVSKENEELFKELVNKCYKKINDGV